MQYLFRKVTTNRRRIGPGTYPHWKTSTSHAIPTIVRYNPSIKRAPLNRRKFLPLFACLALLVFSACIRSFTPVPASPPEPDINQVRTRVIQTLTAHPSSTLPPASPAALTPTPPLQHQWPQDFIAWYFDSINARNYTLTWSLLSERYQENVNGPSQGGYQGYVDFWNTVKQANVKAVSYFYQQDVCIAKVTLQLLYYNGQIENSTFTYTLTYDRSRNTWLFDFIPTLKILDHPAPSAG